MKKGYFLVSYEFLSYILREILTFKCISSKTRPDLPTLSLRVALWHINQVALAWKAGIGLGPRDARFHTLNI